MGRRAASRWSWLGSPVFVLQATTVREQGPLVSDEEGMEA